MPSPGEESREEQQQQQRLPQRRQHNVVGGLKSWLTSVWQYIPHTPRSLLHSTNFFRWHVIIGLLVPPAAAGLICACNTNLTVAYIDALFMSTSALTLTGLTVVNMSQLSFGQQFIIYLLLQVGSLQFVSLISLLARRAVFNRIFDENHRFFPTRRNKNVKKDAEAAEVVLEVSNGNIELDGRGNVRNEESKKQDKEHSRRQGERHHNNDDDDETADDDEGQSDENADRDQQQQSSPTQSKNAHQSGRGGFPNPLSSLYSTGWDQLRRRYQHNNDSGYQQMGEPLLPSMGKGGKGGKNQGESQGEKEDRLRRATTRWGRNSDIVGKEGLGKEGFVRLARLEISAMTLLIYAVVFYWLAWQIFAILLWAPYFSAGHFDSTLSTGGSPATSKTWFAIFQSASFINNSGLSLVDTSLTGLQTCYIMLIPGVFMIVLGNLGYPIGLRALLFFVNRLAPAKSSLKQLSTFVLAHPRRVFFYLFPPYETVALAVAVLILTSVDWVCFYILDINYQTNAVFSLPGGTAFIDGLVQSTAVRSAGFYVINLYETSPALHVLYIFMMIFAIYPIALAIRATNVYEEKALGITESTEDSVEAGLRHLKQEEGYVGLHLKEQLAYDVWYIIFTVWLICIIERNQLETPSRSFAGNFTTFDVIFEVCSAYANVGLSIGSPSNNTSTSGSFRHLSKLLLCLTMVRGRTRGLPIQIDRAIMTPRQLGQHGDPPDGPMQNKEAEKEAVHTE